MPAHLPLHDSSALAHCTDHLVLLRFGGRLAAKMGAGKDRGATHCARLGPLYGQVRTSAHGPRGKCPGHRPDANPPFHYPDGIPAPAPKGTIPSGASRGADLRGPARAIRDTEGDLRRRVHGEAEFSSSRGLCHDDPGVPRPHPKRKDAFWTEHHPLDVRTDDGPRIDWVAYCTAGSPCGAGSRSAPVTRRDP
jgi:hypothetical protein